MLIATIIKTAKIFKRYIDDIVFLSNTLEVTDNVKKRLKCAFEEHNQNLVFREISTKNDIQVQILQRCALVRQEFLTVYDDNLVLYFFMGMREGFDRKSYKKTTALRELVEETGYYYPLTEVTNTYMYEEA